MVKRMRGRPKESTVPKLPKQKRGTSLTFSTEELTVLGRFVAAGQVMLATDHPVLGRIKGARRRGGLPAPKGL